MSNRYTRKFSIGLTGGIGSGKSTIADMFNRLGIATIDSDAISRQLTAANGIGSRLIADEFGEQYLQEDGQLDRQKMRSLVFNDEKQKQKLESILHPLIRQESSKQADISNSDYIVFDIPLLIETQQMECFDRVLCVITPLDKRLDYITKRSNIPATQVMQIISSQVGDLLRKKHADDIIENNSSLESLEEKVINLHKQYLLLSQS